MNVPESLRSNLKFLLVEVNSQLERLRTYLDEESLNVAHSILSRSGYTANLVVRIYNACSLQVTQQSPGENQTLRAITSIANDLENVMELNRECVQQISYLPKTHRIDLRIHRPYIRKIAKCLALVEKSLFGKDTQLALKLATVEVQLDRFYKKLLYDYTRQLKKKRHTSELVTALFVAHAVEQMGDALLRISESIISSNMGQPMDIQRYHFLKDTIGQRADDADLADLDIKRMADTRSGSAIASVNYQDQDNNHRLVVFKDGKKRKLKKEVSGVKKWHRIFPGVAPQIIRYKKQGDSAALLIEHLEGTTFEQLVLKASPKLRAEAMSALKKTLYSVWGSTRKDNPVCSNFVDQIRRRLDDVLAIHPEFQLPAANICGHKVDGLEQRLARVEKLEKRISAPFKVFIHGDFNIDNVLYDRHRNTIRFIDLHRSTHMDYVQDASVFMVSNYRLQVLSKPVRQRIEHQVETYYQLVRRFSQKQGDETFEVRMALGLARSLITSTRFILDKTLATKMFLRANYLLDQVLALNKSDYLGYRLPIKAIFSS